MLERCCYRGNRFTGRSRRAETASEGFNLITLDHRL